MVSMKFSLKSIGFFVLLAALLASTISSKIRSRKLEKKLFALRESHGFVTQETYGKSGDRWEVVPLGSLTSPSDTFLIRVSNFEKYQLRIHFYDGVSREYTSATHGFVANETVVRYLSEHDTIFVHDTTWPIDNQTIFKITGTSRFYNIRVGFASDLIGDDPVFGFGMLTTDIGPLGISIEPYRNRENIEATCVEHKMKMAWFTIEKK